MQLRVLLLLCLTGALGVPRESIAQTDDSSSTLSSLYWLTLGFGAVTPAFGGMLEASYAMGGSPTIHSSLSVKAEGGSTITMFDGVEQSNNWLSIDYGWYLFDRGKVLRLAAGPAYFSQTQDTVSFFGQKSGYTSSHGFGLSLEAEGMLPIFRSADIAVILSAMLAPGRAFWGLTLNAAFGRLQ